MFYIKFIDGNITMLAEHPSDTERALAFKDRERAEKEAKRYLKKMKVPGARTEILDLKAPSLPASAEEKDWI